MQKRCNYVATITYMLFSCNVDNTCVNTYVMAKTYVWTHVLSTLQENNICVIVATLLHTKYVLTYMLSTLLVGRVRNQAPEAYAGVARHQGGPNLPEHVWLVLACCYIYPGVFEHHPNAYFLLRTSARFAKRFFLLFFRNELPTWLDFTPDFRNELPTLQNPISIAPYCTVSRLGSVHVVRVLAAPVNGLLS